MLVIWWSSDTEVRNHVFKSGGGAFDSAKNRARANAANAKVRNRQMIGRPTIL